MPWDLVWVSEAAPPWAAGKANDVGRWEKVAARAGRQGGGGNLTRQVNSVDYKTL